MKSIIYNITERESRQYKLIKEWKAFHNGKYRYLDTHNIERHPAPCPEWPHDLGLVRNLRQVLDTAARGAAVTAWETRDGEEADMFWVSSVQSDAQTGQRFGLRKETFRGK